MSVIDVHICCMHECSVSIFNLLSKKFIDMHISCIHDSLPSELFVVLFSTGNGAFQGLGRVRGRAFGWRSCPEKRGPSKWNAVKLRTPTGYETYGPRLVTLDTGSKLPSSLLLAAPIRENMAIALNGCLALRFMTGLGRLRLEANCRPLI